MVAKDDKDGQIVLLRDALKKILEMAGEPDDNAWGEFQILSNVAKVAQTALFDTTF